MSKPKSSEAVDAHTYSPNEPKKFKQTFVCQKTDGNGFLEQEGNANFGIHVSRDHNNVKSVLKGTKNLRVAVSKKARNAVIRGSAHP
jgi:hypothetical protein